MIDTMFNSSLVAYPKVRLRRLRKNQAIRDLMQETHLSKKDLICPIFVQEGISKPVKIKSMGEIKRFPLKNIDNEIESIIDLGIKAIILFGIPSNKDANATSAFDDDGIVQRTVRHIRKSYGEKLAIITDVCMCQYTSTGHCGIVKNKTVDNDSSLQILGKIAASHAHAGADMIAPSAMMDGQVHAIRENLDSNGFTDTGIIGYSAKLASPLYGPFRDAANSYPEFGDRKSYQMPFTNRNEALKEVETDINEGADIVMVKPAIPYLDLIYQIRERTTTPVCAYSVSGEYAMIKAAALEGWLNEDNVMTELLVSIKRAGADMIITYHAKRMAQLLDE